MEAAVDEARLEGEAFAQLVADWRARPRPLFIFDEVRIQDEGTPGQLFAFYFLVLDTQTACELADHATAIRSGMSKQGSESLVKGATLYGSRRRDNPDHDAFRSYAESALERCFGIVRVITSSPTIKRYKTLAPGGIAAIRPDGTNADPAALRGRELVPFLHMLHLIGEALRLGEVQVDVLLDSSAQLGFGHLAEDRIAFVGPGRIDVRPDGTHIGSVNTTYYLVAAPEASAFRDLLLLPDATAYRERDTLGSPRDAHVSGQDFVIETRSLPGQQRLATMPWFAR